MSRRNKTDLTGLLVVFVLALLGFTVEKCSGQTRLIDAIIRVESKGVDDAVGDGGLAVGCLQIHKVLVDDVNRIVGYNKYTYSDRLSRIKSVEMFDIYTNHYSKGCSDEVKARRWNGGPKGDKKPATEKYWLKVKAQLRNKE